MIKLVLTRAILVYFVHVAPEFGDSEMSIF